MDIPFVNLSRQYKTIQKAVDTAIRNVCTSSDFILGPHVNDFETNFARFLDVSSCIGVASGTDAIKLMGMAAHIHPGDEVIIQANTFIATVLPFLELGATVIFADCDEHTGQVSVHDVAKRMTKKTKAIVPVHLYGHPAPIKELIKLVKQTPSVQILEDAAQAHGSSVAGNLCGSFGAMAAFSFYPGKNLGAYGDGGAVVTNNAETAEHLRTLRNIGQTKKYDHQIIGVNSRLDSIQAAILLVKLKHLSSWNKKRTHHALKYIQGLSGVGDIITPNTTPAKKSGIQTNWHLFVIRTQYRDALAAYLLQRGIHTGIHYPVALHLTPALLHLGYKKGDFPSAEKRADTMLSLPLFPELKERESSYIVKTIQTFYKNLPRALTT